MLRSTVQSVLFFFLDALQCLWQMNRLGCRPGQPVRWITHTAWENLCCLDLWSTVQEGGPHPPNTIDCSWHPLQWGKYVTICNGSDWYVRLCWGKWFLWINTKDTERTKNTLWIFGNSEDLQIPKKFNVIAMNYGPFLHKANTNKQLVMHWWRKS